MLPWSAVTIALLPLQRMGVCCYGGVTERGLLQAFKGQYLFICLSAELSRLECVPHFKV